MSNKSIKIYDFIEQLTYNYWSKTRMGQYTANISIVKLIGYYNILIFVINILKNSKYYLKYSIKKIPYVKNKITDERQKIIKSIHTKFDKQLSNIEAHELPKIGFNSDKIISLFDNLITKSDSNYRDGRVSGATYSNNKDLDKMLVQVFPYFNKSNPLHTNLYPSVRKTEQKRITKKIK